MAFTETQRLNFGGDTIDFAELQNNIQADDLDHIIHKDKSGGTTVLRRTGQTEWPAIDVVCTESEANVTIRTWIANRSQVVFTPKQTSAPGTTHTVRIINPTFPMAPWGQGKWRGTLYLRKVL